MQKMRKGKRGKRAKMWIGNTKKERERKHNKRVKDGGGLNGGASGH